MTDHDKIERIQAVIEKYHLTKQVFSPDEVYEHMKGMELYELAEDISEFTTVISEIWKIMEGEE